MSKRGIVLYLHVHQPWRVRQYSIFDTARHHDYFNEQDLHTDRNNEKVFRKVADKSYRPMNELLEKLLTKHPDFKLALSITGTFIEQAEQWAPDVLESFRRLVATGRVEIALYTTSILSAGMPYRSTIKFFVILLTAITRSAIIRPLYSISCTSGLPLKAPPARSNSVA